ncbi:MAG: hypothetical protein WDO24_06390 [Pseudomonadota bacterium]
MAQSKLQAALSEAVAALPRRSQPKPLYAAIEKSLGTLIGHKLFTLMIFDERNRTMQRVYSNQPKAYPVAAASPIAPRASMMPCSSGTSRASCTTPTTSSARSPITN